MTLNLEELVKIREGMHKIDEASSFANRSCRQIATLKKLLGEEIKKRILEILDEFPEDFFRNIETVDSLGNKKIIEEALRLGLYGKNEELIVFSREVLIMIGAKDTGGLLSYVSMSPLRDEEYFEHGMDILTRLRAEFEKALVTKQIGAKTTA